MNRADLMKEIQRAAGFDEHDDLTLTQVQAEAIVDEVIAPFANKCLEQASIHSEQRLRAQLATAAQILADLTEAWRHLKLDTAEDQALHAKMLQTADEAVAALRP